MIVAAATALIVASALSAGVILLNEKYAIFSDDRFPTPLHKFLAYGWLTVLFVTLAVVITASSLSPATAADLETTPFWSLFVLHLLLAVFLLGWWLLAGRPKITRFMSIRTDVPLESILLGFAVGVGGWAITIASALVLGLVLHLFEVTPQKLAPSPMIPWLAALPAWKKMLIVASAMTVEEAFFRGWLQKRAGLVISTIIFALSHAGYGQPLMLVGITVISLVIGYTFYRTKDLTPCIVAHGVFDTIQIFVIVPLAIKFGGLG
jgi:membrane protease YdiL (CAAX protease family)